MKNRDTVNKFLMGLGLCYLLFIPELSFAQRVVTLESALQIAEENSPDLMEVKLQLERNQELLNAQRASLRTRFDLDLNPFRYYKNREFFAVANDWLNTEQMSSEGTFRVTQPLIWTGGSVSLENRFSFQDSKTSGGQFDQFTGDQSTTAYTNNLYLTLNQPIFTYNQLKMDLDRIELDYENAYMAYVIRRLNLEANVSQAFYNVYNQQMQVIINEEEYANQKESHDIIKNKVESGLQAKEELYQAELNLATSESNLFTAQMNLQNVLDDFKEVTGLALDEEIEVLTKVEITEIDVDLDRAIDYGLNQRLELRQRDLDIKNSEFDLIQAKATNEFKGNVALRLGLIGQEAELNNIYANPTDDQLISISLSVPIFDWGEKKSRVKAAQAQIKSSQLSLKVEERNIVKNLRQIHRDFGNSKLQIKLAEQNLKNAQLTYDINLERYRNGDLTSIDLNVFQNQLSEKKITLVNAQIDYKLALLNIKIQSLWDFEFDQPFLPEDMWKNRMELDINK
ncbi:TolC family protein [Sediminitomix flava]|uniref:Outer membrane protein TolC n=1 Tax=Sediminitomix flava TaxID=379075 RepID=A0A315Z8R4_SEDFL|nr:TolC family protein [Sediminitomix flava]PWJ41966.1 outer membrane protein TolC [Sediminitomix flava]